MYNKNKFLAVIPAFLPLCLLMFTACFNPLEGDTEALRDSVFDELKVPVRGFSQKLAWLESNARSGKTYIIEVDANETIAPHTVSVGSKNGVRVLLRSRDSNRIIKPSSPSENAMFTVKSGAILVLDSYITLEGLSNNNAALVKVEAGGEFVMEAGSTIKNNKIKRAGAIECTGVLVDGGTFTMNGGEISGNEIDATTYSRGGGVMVKNNGTFNMNNGTISGNKIIAPDSSRGGAVYVDGGTFTMNGGTIKDNEAFAEYDDVQGGAVYVNDGKFTMNGGTISENTAISDRRAFCQGGGVYVSYGSFTMSGGTIGENKVESAISSYGGGVYVSNSPFTMSGGTIYGNMLSPHTAPNADFKSYGGGVYVGDGPFTMSGGIISNNKASSLSSSYGGGVYVKDGNFEKTGVNSGIIYGYNEGDTKSNEVRHGSQAPEKQGYAVYVVNGAQTKYKDSTAGTIVNMSLMNSTPAGGWDESGGNVYYVFFDANEGTGTMVEYEIPLNSNRDLTANTFERMGYAFLGWAVTPQGEVKFLNRHELSDNPLTTTPGKTVTLYAKWTNDSSLVYTVVFDANGGSGTMASFTGAASALGSLPPNSFARDGHAYLGWAETPAGNVKYTDQGSIPSGTYQAKTTVILYAVWSPSYTVVYDPNRGAGTGDGLMPDSSIAVGVETPLRSNTFTRVGYTFEGWAKTSNAAAAEYQNGQSVKDLAGQGLTQTLYAVWEPVTYTVQYNANGGNGSSMDDSNFTYDEQGSLEKNTYTRVGYTFDGWATFSNGPVEYEDEELVHNLRDTAGVYNLYAVWNPVTYTVKFDANASDSTGDMDNSTFIYDANNHLPPNSYTRSGYVFAGWAETPAGGIVYANHAIVTVNLAQTQGANVTLYAVWKEAYSVVYDANGGVGDMEDSIFNNDENYTLRLNTFTRAGYTFNGWAKTAGGTVTYPDGHSVYNLATVPGETITLFAVWNPISYTVSYNANGGSGAAMANTGFTYDESKCLEVCTYTRAGYTFEGWARSAGGNKAFDDEELVSNLRTSVGNVSLFAVWKPITYTVKYDANGGDDDGSMEPTVFTYGISQSLRINTFEHSGYEFTGWAVTKTGTVEYTDGATINNMTETQGEEFTLYAVWRIRADGSEEHPYPLTANTWLDETITSTAYGTAVWYSFDVSHGVTYHVWWDDSYFNHEKSLAIKVSAHYSHGGAIFTELLSWYSPQSFTADANGMVKIKVEPYSSGYTGTFAIAFNTTGNRP